MWGDGRVGWLGLGPWIPAVESPPSPGPRRVQAVTRSGHDCTLLFIFPWQVAQANSVRNAVDVELRCGDLFAPFEAAERADLILCNPPYISLADFAELDPSVRDFEPTKALVSGMYVG